MSGQRVQKQQTLPITVIFKFMQTKAKVQIWLFEQINTRFEGKILGFDEYMNIVLDDADELDMKRRTKKPLGRILLKGDNVTCIMQAPAPT